jgi:hypothetical protein
MIQNIDRDEPLPAVFLCENRASRDMRLKRSNGMR